ncbi:MAG: TRAP transporter substrate-binding protein [Albidovulum sp.]
MKNTMTAIAAGALVSLGTAAVAETNWDMPMAYPESNFHTEFGHQFADAVRECTGGSLNITIHSGGSLFKGNEIKRAVQIGQAPIGERFLSAHQNENPIYGVDSIPFLATSYEASDRLWNASKEAVGDALESDGLVLIYSVPWPAQGLYFNQEVNSVADMEGIKFRAYNSATSRLAELAGMLPVQIEAADLAQALSTGVASSFISSGSTGYDTKVWELLTHFYDTQAWLPRNAVFANKSAYDALTAEEQSCLQSSGADVSAGATAKSEELASWYLEQFTANGMTVVAPSDELKAELAEFGAIMTAEWLEAAGDTGAAVIDAYRASQ